MPAIVKKNKEIMIVSFGVFRLILVKMKHCFNYTLIFTFCQIKKYFFCLKQDLQDGQDAQDEEAKVWRDNKQKRSVRTLIAITSEAGWPG